MGIGDPANRHGDEEAGSEEAMSHGMRPDLERARRVDHRRDDVKRGAVHKMGTGVAPEALFAPLEQDVRGLLDRSAGREIVGDGDPEGAAALVADRQVGACVPVDRLSAM